MVTQSNETLSKEQDFVLVVDIGNTAIKWGWFYKGELLSSERFNYGGFSQKDSDGSIPEDSLQINKANLSHTLKNKIGESFRNLSSQLPENTGYLADYHPANLVEIGILYSNPQMLHPVKETIEAVFESSNPVKLFGRGKTCRLIDTTYYQTGELGSDRLANMLAVQKHYPKAFVGIIDLGTACTIDWIGPDLTYKGGCILPGMDLAYETFKNRFSEVLSQNFKEAYQAFPIESATPFSKNSSQGILSGFILGYFYSIEGLIQNGISKIDTKQGSLPIHLVLCGGASDLFYHWCLSNISTSSLKRVRHLPNLTLEGIYQWLDDEDRASESILLP
ncbi:MAG: type III pantothenate kinase [Candidatus Melainabacteria bacterium]|nr:type III pantothenate kinase [Candidatus Melainabacteria bacterium]